MFFEIMMSSNLIRFKILGPLKDVSVHAIVAAALIVGLTICMFYITGWSLEPALIAAGETETKAKELSPSGILEGYASVINVAITIISIGIAWGLFAQAETSRRLNRKADVIISCIDRYERLSNFDAEFGKPDHAKAQHYYSQYFALKSDQVDFYLAGWIDSDTFITWMRAMVRSWVKGRLYYGKTLKSGWHQTRGFHAVANNIFFQLMLGVEVIAKTARKPGIAGGSDAYMDRAFQILMIEFYDRTRGTRRLLRTDFEPARYFREGRTVIFDASLKARLELA